jgi:hypothetical protein
LIKQIIKNKYENDLELLSKFMEAEKITNHLCLKLKDIQTYRKENKINNNNKHDNNYNNHLTESTIEELMKNESLKLSVRNILGVKKNDDWINFLNIGNIMYLSPITYEDLDLESDSKFELLRDAMLEKVIL